MTNHNGMSISMSHVLVRDIESEEDFMEMVAGSCASSSSSSSALPSRRCVVCQFYAAWSRHCAEDATQYEQLAQQNSNIATFCRVNVDEADDLLLLVEHEYQATISDLPTWLVFCDGHLTATLTDQDHLQQLITTVLHKNNNSRSSPQQPPAPPSSTPASDDHQQHQWKKMVRAPSLVLAGILPGMKPCCQSGNGCTSTSVRSTASGINTISPKKPLSALEGMTPATKPCCPKEDCGTSQPWTSNQMTDTSNVLVQYTLQDLDRRAESNFWLGLICLGVCAVNVVLMLLNWSMHHIDKEGNQPHVSKYVFHMLEFWTSHIYAIAEAFALVTSPKTMLHIYNKPNLLKLLLFFTVVNSLVPALLISLDRRYFERTAHELEFINSFTLSFITMILLASLLHPTSPQDLANMGLAGQVTTPQHDSNSIKDNLSSVVMGLVACLVAATNFIIYNAGWEALAHYLEFSFNVFVSLITFWFCMDNRFVAQMEIGQILYGRDQNCIFCQIRGNEPTSFPLDKNHQNPAATLNASGACPPSHKNKTRYAMFGGDSTAVRVGVTESVVTSSSSATSSTSTNTTSSSNHNSKSYDLEAPEHTTVSNERTPLMLNGGGGGHGGGCGVC